MNISFNGYIGGVKFGYIALIMIFLYSAILVLDFFKNNNAKKIQVGIMTITYLIGIIGLSFIWLVFKFQLELEVKLNKIDLKSAKYIENDFYMYYIGTVLVFMLIIIFLITLVNRFKSSKKNYPFKSLSVLILNICAIHLFFALWWNWGINFPTFNINNYIALVCMLNLNLIFIPYSMYVINVIKGKTFEQLVEIKNII